MVPFCTRCGTKQTDKDARFCSSCGHNLNTEGVAVEQPSSSTQPQQRASEEYERVLRDEESADLKTTWSRASAASGKPSTKYRLTNKALYVTKGIFISTSTQTPLWAVTNVSLRREMMIQLAVTMMNWRSEEKQEELGDVTIESKHPDYTGGDAVVLKNIADPEEVRRLINEHSHRERLIHERRKKTNYYGQSE